VTRRHLRLRGAAVKRGRYAAWLLGACLALPAAAQQPGRAYRVALLAPGEGSVVHTRRHTLPVLERAGFVEGRNLVLDVRVPGGAPERLAAAASELAASKPDAVIAVANGAGDAARRAMPATPLLMAFADDPVGQGFVQSLARPGGWITGVALQSTEANRKRVELARELLLRAGEVIE
jgi:putative ABC transport system substrate-binding protein